MFSLPDMEQKKLTDFLNRYRGTVDTVIGFYDQFTVRMVQVTAPVRNNSIRSARDECFFSVPDNGMKVDRFGYCIPQSTGTETGIAG